MISIAGVALPYGMPTIVDGHREFVAGFALAEFLARRPRVFLTWQDHDAPSICDSVELLDFDYALGFRAELSEKVWSRICAELLNGCGASVEFAPGFVATRDYHRGKLVNRVDRASIRHITLTRHPVYAATAAWPEEGDFKLDDHVILARDRFYASEACLL